MTAPRCEAVTRTGAACTNTAFWRFRWAESERPAREQWFVLWLCGRHKRVVERQGVELKAVGRADGKPLDAPIY